MKTLKKGKQFKKVEPLPKGWLGMKEIAAQVESDGTYRKSFIQLKKLLDDGWTFSPHEPRRNAEWLAAEKAESKKKNKKVKKNLDKKPE